MAELPRSFPRSPMAASSSLLLLLLVPGSSLVAAVTGSTRGGAHLRHLIPREAAAFAHRPSQARPSSCPASSPFCCPAGDGGFRCRPPSIHGGAGSALASSLSPSSSPLLTATATKKITGAAAEGSAVGVAVSDSGTDVGGFDRRRQKSVGGGIVRGGWGSRGRLAKSIWKYGSDWEGALGLLLDLHPYLRDVAGFVDDDVDPVPLSSPPLDGRAAAAAVEVLGKCARVGEMLQLLDRIVDLYRRERPPASDELVSESDVRMCYRAAFPGIASSSSPRKGDESTGVDLILRLIRHDMPAKAGIVAGPEAYHAAIAACGRIRDRGRNGEGEGLGGADAALELLEEMERGERVRVSSRGARESPDDKGEDTNDEGRYALSGYVPPPPDRMAYQTALTACVRSKRCDEAADVLSRMRQRGVDPDISSYNQAVAAFEKVRGRSSDALRLLDEMEGGGPDGVPPNEVTYNLVVSACGKDGAWEEAASVMDRMTWRGFNAQHSSKSAPLPTNVIRRARTVAGMTEGVPHGECFASYFRDLNLLPKRGTGKDAWWELGRYSGEGADGLDVVVGVQPHRNPVRNGVSLNFYDASREKYSKMGFVLLRNGHEEEEPPAATAGNATMADKPAPPPAMKSSMIGMLVEEDHRGRGLSTLFVAIWLRLSVDLEFHPAAERINKPLIAVALERFGFVPREGGVPLEVSPAGDGKSISLYSPKRQALEGIFGERERRVQGLVITQDPPSPRGRIAHVRTGFVHPISRPNDGKYDREEVLLALEECIATSLGGNGGDGSITFSSKASVRRRALFGFALSSDISSIPS